MTTYVKSEDIKQTGLSWQEIQYYLQHAPALLSCKYFNFCGDDRLTKDVTKKYANHIANVTRKLVQEGAAVFKTKTQMALAPEAYISESLLRSAPGFAFSYAARCLDLYEDKATALTESVVIAAHRATYKKYGKIRNTAKTLDEARDVLLTAIRAAEAGVEVKKRGMKLPPLSIVGIVEMQWQDAYLLTIAQICEKYKLTRLQGDDFKRTVQQFRSPVAYWFGQRITAEEVAKVSLNAAEEPAEMTEAEAYQYFAGEWEQQGRDAFFLPQQGRVRPQEVMTHYLTTAESHGELYSKDTRYPRTKLSMAFCCLGLPYVYDPSETSVNAFEVAYARTHKAIEESSALPRKRASFEVLKLAAKEIFCTYLRLLMIPKDKQEKLASRIGFEYINPTPTEQQEPEQEVIEEMSNNTTAPVIPWQDIHSLDTNVLAEKYALDTAKALALKTELAQTLGQMHAKGYSQNQWKGQQITLIEVNALDAKLDASTTPPTQQEQAPAAAAEQKIGMFSTDPKVFELQARLLKSDFEYACSLFGHTPESAQDVAALRQAYTECKKLYGEHEQTQAAIEATIKFVIATLRGMTDGCVECSSTIAQLKEDYANQAAELDGLDVKLAQLRVENAVLRQQLSVSAELVDELREKISALEAQQESVKPDAISLWKDEPVWFAVPKAKQPCTSLIVWVDDQGKPSVKQFECIQDNDIKITNVITSVEEQTLQAVVMEAWLLSLRVDKKFLEQQRALAPTCFEELASFDTISKMLAEQATFITEQRDADQLKWLDLTDPMVDAAGPVLFAFQLALVQGGNTAVVKALLSNSDRELCRKIREENTGITFESPELQRAVFEVIKRNISNAACGGIYAKARKFLMTAGQQQARKHVSPSTVAGSLANQVRMQLLNNK